MSKAVVSEGSERKWYRRQAVYRYILCACLLAAAVVLMKLTYRKRQKLWLEIGLVYWYAIFDRILSPYEQENGVFHTAWNAPFWFISGYA